MTCSGSRPPAARWPWRTPAACACGGGSIGSAARPCTACCCGKVRARLPTTSHACAFSAAHVDAHARVNCPDLPIAHTHGAAGSLCSLHARRACLAHAHAVVGQRTAGHSPVASVLCRLQQFLHADRPAVAAGGASDGARVAAGRHAARRRQPAGQHRLHLEHA